MAASDAPGTPEEVVDAACALLSKGTVVRVEAWVIAPTFVAFDCSRSFAVFVGAALDWAMSVVAPATTRALTSAAPGGVGAPTAAVADPGDVVELATPDWVRLLAVT